MCLNRRSRVWNNSTKRWLTRRIGSASVHFDSWERFNPELHPKEELIENQCTCIPDKRDVHIFEDDIVKLEIYNGRKKISVIGVVKLIFPTYTLVSTQGIFTFTEEDSQFMEVIGNIREDSLYTVKNNPLRLKAFELSC